jgi:hypothetical protein
LCPDCTSALAERLTELGPPPISLRGRSPLLIVIGICVLTVAWIMGAWTLGVVGLVACLIVRRLVHSGPDEAWRLRHDEILTDLLDGKRG